PAAGRPRTAGAGAWAGVRLAAWLSRMGRPGVCLEERRVGPPASSLCGVGPGPLGARAPRLLLGAWLLEPVSQPEAVTTPVRRRQRELYAVPPASLDLENRSDAAPGWGVPALLG